MIEDRVSSVICQTYFSQVLAGVFIGLTIGCLIESKLGTARDAVEFYAFGLIYASLWVCQAILAHKARAAAKNASTESITALRWFRYMSICMGILHLPVFILSIMLFIAACKTKRLIRSIKYLHLYRLNGTSFVIQSIV